jgi:hypothetical protein
MCLGKTGMGVSFRAKEKGGPENRAALEENGRISSAEA